MTIRRRTFLVAVIYLLWLGILQLLGDEGIDPRWAFATGVVLLFALDFPTYVLSPRNILFGYYFLWYAVAPAVSMRYQEIDFSLQPYPTAFAMLFATYGFGYIILSYVEPQFERLWYFKQELTEKTHQVSPRIGLWTASSVAIIAAALIVGYSGGIDRWIEEPGQAFLTREGTGLFSVVLTFSITIAAGYAGAWALQTGRARPVIGFALLCLVLSPVIGSKMQIFLTLALALLPWSLRAHTWSAAAMFGAILLFVGFFLGTYFRNVSWIELGGLLEYSFDYFSTLEMLAISLRDFPPSWFLTFFLPFNKWLTPFGQDPSLHYDMSSWLTSIYFPESWAIRATEQWPIETDLYLSFAFIYGLPVLIPYFWFTGWLFRKALMTRQLGFAFCSVYVSFGLVSHLRGGVINWTDFYLFPFLLFAYWLFRGISIDLRRPGKD